MNLRHIGRALPALIISLWLVLSGIAVAAPTPYVSVEDQAGVLTAAQLADLVSGFGDLRYHYQVVILAEAFSGATPTNPTAQFQLQTSQMFLQRHLSGDTVLVAVAMKERLIDFEVLRLGAINQEFQTRTGAEFAVATPKFVDAFGTVARTGDIAGGIRAAVRAIEQTAGAWAATPLPSPPPTPQPVPSQAPQPVPSPTAPWPPGNSPAPGYDQPSGSAGSPVNGGWILAGFFGGAAGIGYLVKSMMFRRRRRETVARGVALAADLEPLNREVPAARRYSGRETATLVERVDVALTAAQEALAAGDANGAEADRLARRMRFAKATASLELADAAYETGSSKCQEAKEAWAPVLAALTDGDALLTDVQSLAGQAVTRLSGEQMRTGWTLAQIDTRIGNLRTALPPVRRLWPEDPVAAVRQARDLQAGGQAILTDLAALAPLEALLAEREGEREQVAEMARQARNTLALRFVEAAPEDRLTAAADHARTAQAALAAGDVPAARLAVDEAANAVAQARDIVTRYQDALTQCPVKAAELEAALPVLAEQERQAAETVSALPAQYDRDDWADVADVPDRLGVFRSGMPAKLAEAARLTDPSVQRLLAAHELLDGLLAERSQLDEAFRTLQARPAELAATADRAAAYVRSAEEGLMLADRQTQADDLVLPADLANDMAQVRRTLSECQTFGQQRPLPVGRWAQAAESLAAQADQVRTGVVQLAAQAEEARTALQQARNEAMRTMAYSNYDSLGSGLRLQNLLTLADDALTIGQYADVLVRTQEAFMLSQALEQAYHRHLEEEREEEERRRRAADSTNFSSMNSGSDSGSFGGGSSGGGSNDSSPTSGGGGSW